ncbi:MAG TPA: selenide, water dikinase SelD [Bacteroidales bacterium]|nr:selenide, water dikinase SelD [Bacteroidales bacterium]
MKDFDLLSTVEYGGCSAKLPAAKLSEALSGLTSTPHPDLLVNTDTHDDAGVFKISDELALIQTTDFFPPICSDPYEFGQIAAANALSDVYAMGGRVLSALNIITFPANVSLDILKEILRGGIDKLIEAGGVMMGGHTIVDEVPKYGMAVTGTVNPSKIIKNSEAKPGDVLILTKPIGAGIIMAGKRINEIDDEKYNTVLRSMKQLNKGGAEIMQKYDVKCATDITGFGLAGHALKIALASNVSLKIYPEKVPLFDGTLELAQLGCLPGACFRNMEYITNYSEFDPKISVDYKMIICDAQTSGGLLMCCDQNKTENILKDLWHFGFKHSKIIGCVQENTNKKLQFISE